MNFPSTIYTTTSTVEHHSDRADSRYPLGTKMEYEDGRMFRYVLVGDTQLVPGDIIQGPAVVANDYDTVVVDSESAVGATTVTVTGESTTAASYYAEGWMHVNKAVSTAAGRGQVYRVKDNVLFATSAGKVITLYDWDPIRQTLAAADEIGLTPNAYRGVLQAPTDTLTCMIVGVAVRDVTDAQYGWVATRGLCAVAATDDLVVGNKASAVLTAAGRVGQADGFIDQTIGVAMGDVATTADFAAVYLTLDN